ncbi:MAG: hypothetical protein ACO3JL_04160 [Myxococcota bacterium]
MRSKSLCASLLLSASFLACEGELSVPVALPVADAGFDQVLFLGGEPSVQVHLDGRASCDPTGGALTSATWTIVSAPVAPPELSAADTLTASFDATEPGDYQIALLVEAGDRQSDTDFLAVRVEQGNGDDITVGPPATDACGAPLDVE